MKHKQYEQWILNEEIELTPDQRKELADHLAECSACQSLQIGWAATKELLQKALEVQERLYRETKNPFHLYRKGQLYLGLGDKASARECFGLACKKSHDYYTRPACELYRKLSQVP